MCTLIELVSEDCLRNPALRAVDEAKMTKPKIAFRTFGPWVAAAQ
jgi:hypothetical protein